MTMGARCDHCNADDAVVVIQDYENDRFLYACTVCEWWGFDPLRLASPPCSATFIVKPEAAAWWN
jgi:hypothetical protein